jgi:hypothetical protein
LGPIHAAGKHELMCAADSRRQGRISCEQAFNILARIEGAGVQEERAGD